MDALQSWSPVATAPALMDLSSALQQRIADVSAARNLSTVQQSTSLPSPSSSIAAPWDTIADGNSGAGDLASQAQQQQQLMDSSHSNLWMQELRAISPLLLPLLLCILSLCTSLVNIVTHVRYAELQTTSRRILAAASLADVSTSVLHLTCLYVSGMEGTADEELHAWLLMGMNFGQQSSMMLNVAFVLRTYVTVVHGLAPVPNFAAVSTLLAVAPPALALALAAVRNRCHDEWSGYDVVLMEPFRVMAVVAVAAMCLVMDRHVTKEVSAPDSQYSTYPAIRAAQVLQRKMRVFPLLFLAVNLPTCYQAWSVLVGGVVVPHSPTTSVPMVLSYHGQSLGNFVLFCLATKVARRCSTDMLLTPIVHGFQTKSLASGDRKPPPLNYTGPGNAASASNLQAARGSKRPQVGRDTERWRTVFISRSRRSAGASHQPSLPY